MRYFIIFVLIIALILLILLLIKTLRSSPGKQLQRDIKALFREMEKEYEKLIKQKLDFEIIKNENLNIDIDAVATEIEPLLKPYLDALFALVSSNHIDTLMTGLNDLKYFKNIYFVTQRLLTEKLPLTHLEKDELHQALSDALKADIAKRALQLKTGI